MTSTSAEQQQQQQRRPNRLASEKSPYLLQHAYNPVDWYPWGEEAFQKARRENKPIFLSVGYSTCHWCHVMERESFENNEIAAILNTKYVPIKVDREERPDVDRVYMTFVQATTGTGGWPMSVWLTPDLKPFVGGTYFPPHDAYRRPGFASILKSLAHRWETDPERLIAAGDQVFSALQDFISKHDDEAPAISTPQGTAEKCYAMLLQRFDSQFGGWNEEGPKFPTPPIMHFLLRYFAMEYSRLASYEMLSQMTEEELEHRLTNAGATQRHYSGKEEMLRAYKSHLDDHNEEVQPALDMVLQTLTKMARGGIHDHVGNGFHRYSTDREWHVPHFEKMLYDQAQLAAIYIDAFTVSRDPFYAQIAEDIFTYVLRDLTHPRGGFFSAEDADSLPAPTATEKKEGAFCVWTANELRDLLGLRKAEIFAFHYGVQEGGNVDARGDPHGELQGKNVLLEKRSLDETARHAGSSLEEVAQLLAECRARLWQHRREQRPRPSLDNKIVTGWNGLMITALARGFQALGKREYLDAAIQAAEFFMTEMFDANTGCLYRSFCDAPSTIHGFVDDYTFFIQGLLDLFEACFEPKYLAWAEQLQRKQDELFWDSKEAGYFSVSDQDASILLRMKEDHDGAEPSPNSIAVMNLFRLGNFLADPSLEDRARVLVAHFDGLLQRVPISMPSLVASSLALFKGCQQITICGPLDHPDTQALVSVVHRHLLPRKVLLVLPPTRSDAFAFLYERNPTARQYQMIDQKPTAYVCRDFSCQAPCHDPTQLDLQLTEVEG